MLLLACVCCTAVATAQQTPRAVSDVVLLDLDGKPAHLPCFGEKHLMIFYIDPDATRSRTRGVHRGAGAQRTCVRATRSTDSGVMNLRDVPMVPNGMARSMAKKRTAQTAPRCWPTRSARSPRPGNLGDCNNMFVLLFGRRATASWSTSTRGVLSEADIQEFIRCSNGTSSTRPE